MTTAAQDASPSIGAAPEFFVRDLEESLRFYVDQLGFQKVHQKLDFAIVTHSRAFLLLAGIEAGVHYQMPAVDEWLAGAPRGVGVNVLITVEDVDALYRRAVASGATIAKPIGDRDYGLRDFVLADPDGYLLRFASRIER